MKYVFATIILFLSSDMAGQRPTQELIPEYLLHGKSASELRLMRNEIFARYGYIFKSEDLARHFSNKKWYQPTESNVDAMLTPTDKKNIERILQFEKQSQPTVLTDLSLEDSYIRSFQNEKTGHKVYRIKEVTYPRHGRFGRLKKVVEKVDGGGEGYHSLVHIETIDESNYWETTKYFNDIILKNDYYMAINFGCCGAEDFGKLYNYTREEEILAFNHKYYRIDVPNSPIKLFLGYSHEESDHEQLELATLSLATLEGLVNKVNFKFENTEDSEDVIWYFSPEINLSSQNEKDRIFDNGLSMQLWSSNHQKDIDKITRFFITINFLGDSSGRKATYTIPITNGRLYGSTLDEIDIQIKLE